MHFSKATIIAMAALLSSGYAFPAGADNFRSGDACQTQQCCDDADSQCRTAPDANMSLCSSQKSTCYTNIGLPSPYGKRQDSQRSGDACQTQECCDDADSQCRTAPDANMSLCSSQKSTCYTNIGLPSPYGKRQAGQRSGDACQTQQCCDDADSKCRTAPGANMSKCSSDKSTCYTTIGLPNPYGKRQDNFRSGDACQSQQCCDDADSKCRTAPGANMSKCSSDKSTCYTTIGLPNPYGKRQQDQNQRSGDACQTQQCCDDADSKCRTAPGANMSKCSSDKSTCYTTIGLPSPYGN